MAPALFAVSALAAATVASASAGHLPASRVSTAPASPAGKPVPRPPVFSPGAGIGAAIPAKPRSVPAIRPLVAWSVNLTASSNDLWPTQDSTLTATASQDVGPTPYYLRIYDQTAGAYVATCASGTSCSATVSQSVATTHRYIAYVSGNSTAFPPTQLQETSVTSFVTWSNLGWRVSLTAPAATFGNETVTATANADVGPTPYYIEIFDEDTGTLIQSCASGSSCSATFTPSYAGSALVAFVSLYSTSYPPGTIVASSNEVTSYLRIIP